VGQIPKDVVALTSNGYSLAIPCLGSGTLVGLFVDSLEMASSCSAAVDWRRTDLEFQLGQFFFVFSHEGPRDQRVDVDSSPVCIPLVRRSTGLSPVGQ
jgi:hypothetical protein